MANWLDPDLPKAFDTVRVFGNNAVHPGTIDLQDDREAATALFMLLNKIADRMIAQPGKIEEIYVSLPSGSREAIDRRDTQMTDGGSNKDG